METHFSDISSLYRCPGCVQQFQRSDSLKRHWKSAFNQKQKQDAEEKKKDTEEKKEDDLNESTTCHLYHRENLSGGRPNNMAKYRFHKKDIFRSCGFPALRKPKLNDPFYIEYKYLRRKPYKMCAFCKAGMKRLKYKFADGRKHQHTVRGKVSITAPVDIDDIIHRTSKFVTCILSCAS